MIVELIDILSDSIHIPLPKGAGPNVDKIGKEIIDEYGGVQITHFGYQFMSACCQND